MEGIILIGLGFGSAYALGHSVIITMGWKQFLAGNNERAMRIFNLVIRLYPRSASGLINRSTILIMYYHDYQGAIDDATKAIQKGKNLATAYNNRGFAYSRLGKFDKAMKDFDKALELEPALSTAHTNRIQILWDRNQDYEEVIDLCEEAIDYDPQNYYLYSIAAHAFMKMEDFNRALEVCQHADKNGLPPAQIHILRADILQKRDDLTQAQPEIDKALVLGPLDSVVIYVLAMIYARSDDYDKARLSVTRLLKANTKSVDLYTWRGSFYSRLRESDKAMADYNRALELNPHSGFAYNARGSHLAKVGQYAQALKDASRCIELEPTYKNGYGTRGEVYFAMGDYDKALADFIQAEELKMDDEFALMGQAISHYKLGDIKIAKSFWAQVIEQEPKLTNPDSFEKEFDPPQSFVDAVYEVAALD